MIDGWEQLPVREVALTLFPVRMGRELPGQQSAEEAEDCRVDEPLAGVAVAKAVPEEHSEGLKTGILAARVAERLEWAFLPNRARRAVKVTGPDAGTYLAQDVGGIAHGGYGRRTHGRKGNGQARRYQTAERTVACL